MKKLLYILGIIFLAGPFTTDARTAKADASCCNNPGSWTSPLGTYLFDISMLINAISQQPNDNPSDNIGSRWYSSVMTYLSNNKFPCQNCSGCAESIYCPQTGNPLVQDPKMTCNVYSDASTKSSCEQAVAATNKQLTYVCGRLFKDCKNS